jgi:hypothetical protein
VQSDVTDHGFNRVTHGVPLLKQIEAQSLVRSPPLSPRDVTSYRTHDSGHERRPHTLG